MNKKYSITKQILLVSDPKSVRFHLLQDDYFGTIATILSLIKQRLPKEKEIAETLNNLENDLVFLQKSYTIAKRQNKKKEIKTPRQAKKPVIKNK